MRRATDAAPRAALKLAALALVLALAAPALGRELEIKVAKTKGIGEDTNDDLRMAGLRFDEPLPRYLAPTAMFSIGLIVAYMYMEGLGAVFLYGGFMQMLAFFFYLFTAAAADSEQAVWQYPLANAKTILSNRGAVGGLYFSLAYWGYALMGGVVGEIISWATLDLKNGGHSKGPFRPFDQRHRHYKMATLRELWGRCFSRLCCPGDVNRDMVPGGYPKDPDYNWEGADMDRTKAAAGMDDTNFSNSCTATSGGDQITWGVALDHIIIVMLIAAAAGPGMDIWKKPVYAWIGFAIFVVVKGAILLFYQHYRYGEAIDHRVETTQEEIDAAKQAGVITPSGGVVANIRRVFDRLTSKFMALYPPFTHIFLFQIAYCILYTVMGSNGAFIRVRFAQNATEARYLANQNLLLEFVTVTISFGVLLLVAITTYFLIIKDVVKKPN